MFFLEISRNGGAVSRYGNIIIIKMTAWDVDIVHIYVICHSGEIIMCESTDSKLSKYDL